MFVIFAAENIFMPRPKRKRQLQMAPKSFGFKPIEAKESFLNFDIELHLDEYESLRLADYKGLSQEEAAVFMKISRPTFTRIYDDARKKMVQAMVENKSLLIAGGQVDFDEEWYRCHDCDDVFSGESHDCDSTDKQNLEHINQSLNRGKEYLHSSKPETVLCECTKCHHQEKKVLGIPCRKVVCPKCNTKSMLRKI